jgi:hypothetical protein
MDKIKPFQIVDNFFQISKNNFDTLSINNNISDKVLDINIPIPNNNISDKVLDINILNNKNIINKTLPLNNDNILITTIKEENYMVMVNKPAIKYWILILLIILVVFSIINSVFAIQFYYSLQDQDEDVKNNIKDMLIVPIINIVFIIICSIAFIIYIYILGNKTTKEFSKMFIITIFSILGILSVIINILLFRLLNVFYAYRIVFNKKKKDESEYIFVYLSNMICIPGWILMIILIYYYLHDPTKSYL